MYNVYNASEIFYLYDIYDGKTSLIGNEKDLIKKIAAAYTFWWDPLKDYHNTFLDNFACSQGDVIVTTRWQFFDGVGRVINPKIYEEQAYALWVKKYKKKQDKRDYRYWQKNKIYKGVFRRTPVEGIHKWRGGPSVRPRHIKHIKILYSIPEYKMFNRGSHKEISLGWWDDWHRCKNKNWKSQSKRRHQWKET